MACCPRYWGGVFHENVTDAGLYRRFLSKPSPPLNVLTGGNYRRRFDADDQRDQVGDEISSPGKPGSMIAIASLEKCKLWPTTK
jgi:hypothetical protein